MKIIEHKILMKEWLYSKNKDFNPEKLSDGSAIKVWWICKLGHEWQDEIRHRVKGDGCPYCSGHRVWIGFNDLKTTHPYLINEWNYEKNGKYIPEHFSKGSAKKVWWICNLGHEWQAAIYHRTKGENCPQCHKTNQTSFAEQAIYYYLLQIYPDVISRYKSLFNNGMEIDIYIPSKKIGIEYDGKYYHENSKSKKRELNKFLICKNNNIKLIRIKESTSNDLISVADYTINSTWHNGKYDELDNTIKELFNYLNI